MPEGRRHVLGAPQTMEAEGQGESTLCQPCRGDHSGILSPAPREELPNLPRSKVQQLPFGVALGSPQIPAEARGFSGSDPILSCSASSCPVQLDLFGSSPAQFGLILLDPILTPSGLILPGSL